MTDHLNIAISKKNRHEFTNYCLIIREFVAENTLRETHSSASLRYSCIKKIIPILKQ